MPAYKGTKDLGTTNRRLVRVSPSELRGSRPGETDRALRARVRREGELASAAREAGREVDRYDNRRRSGDTFSDNVADLMLAIPRERARRRYKEADQELREARGYKKGGKVKKMAKGGSTASKRADGCATKGKTKGRFV